MIKLTDISIENYRSVFGDPLQLSLKDYNVIIGPNNSGKSNILRALQLFFNGNINGKVYDTNVDFPKTNTLGHRAQTKITVSLKFDPSRDTTIENAIQQLETESGQQRLANNILQLRLQYTRKNVEQWRFISRAGLRSIRADLIIPIVDAVRSTIRFKYLPVGRDILDTIRTELSDELIRTIFSGWSGAVRARREINDAIDQLIEKLQPRLSTSATEITSSIKNVFREIQKLELRLPFKDLETVLPSLIPSIHDTHETSLDAKGAGIQTSALLFFLKYLADHHPQRHNLRITYVWALEEPESYLHPANQKSMADVLKIFSDSVQTLITTHSPHFVPRSRKPIIAIIDKDPSPPHSTKIMGNDYELARQLLGVSLLDSMYLYQLNIVVEGPSDEILLRGAWELLYKNGRAKIDPSEIKFLPGNSAMGACTLYESLINFGDTDEVNIILLLDGDPQGKKALKGLMKRTADRKILKANKDYFQLVKNTEWLTSANIMVKLASERPRQINITYNTEDEITDFQISEHHKKKVAKRIIEISSLGDLKGFESLIKRIERTI